MAAFDSQVPRRGTVRSEIVCDHSLGDNGVFLEKLAHQFQRGMLVSLRLDQHIEDLTFSVDGAPEMNYPPIDFQIDLVEMPSGVRRADAVCQCRDETGVGALDA
jgi:hypothetical protein